MAQITKTLLQFNVYKCKVSNMVKIFAIKSEGVQKKPVTYFGLTHSRRDSHERDLHAIQSPSGVRKTHKTFLPPAMSAYPRKMLILTSILVLDELKQRCLLHVCESFIIYL